MLQMGAVNRSKSQKVSTNKNVLNFITINVFVCYDMLSNEYKHAQDLFSNSWNKLMVVGISEDVSLNGECLRVKC